MNLYKSQLIIDNHNLFVNKCNETYAQIVKNINSTETTWNYDRYNFFSITSGDVVFYKLFIELKTLIRSYVNTDDPLWIQCWLNFHKQDEVLDWHNHFWDYHGYISIDPKNTKTIFENGAEIHNEIGNIYIGPCNLKHKVIINEPYDDHRITLGFDIINQNNKQEKGLSFIPLC